jgi:hypothetical protein
MTDQTLSHSREAADLARAPAGAPATATIVPDRLQDGDGTESPPPPDRPEIEPEPVPENDPDLQPIIPPIDTPTI